LCICWGEAGAGGFELGGARLWSVVGLLTTLPLLLPLLVVVGASTSGMLGEVLLGGVESARLDTVPVDDPGDESGGGDDEDVVGIHDDNVANKECTLGGRKDYY